jgi:AcrR family transcriptional regulator
VPAQLSRPESTKARIIEASRQLFAEKGYQATSVVDIQRLADLHSGSIYHFFPTKQQILIDVLASYRDGIESMLLEPTWRDVPDPIDRVFRLLAVYRDLLVASDCNYGCPIGSLALELHEPDPRVRELLEANFLRWTDHIRQCLDAASERFVLPVDTGQLATFILTIMEGAVMQSRTFRSIDAFDASIASLHQYFDLILKP